MTTAPCVALVLGWVTATSGVAIANSREAPPSSRPPSSVGATGNLVAPPASRPCAAGTVSYPEDFGDLRRYRDANSRLGRPQRGERRVVFFGDSITDLWSLESSFPGKGYINRGISGQTTAQMLVRFRQDVIDLRPSVVVILAGTNDLAIHSGPDCLPTIESHLTSLAQLARANGIRVVMCSILPVHNYSSTSAQMLLFRPPEKIRAINRWIKESAPELGYLYLDYFTAMLGEGGLLKRQLANDGLHPNRAGYALMAPLARAAVEQALADPHVRP